MSERENRLWLGTAALGRWGNDDGDDCVDLIHRALDRGVTTIDTAESYSDGDAEEIVGRAIGRRRGSVRVATKFGYRLPDAPPAAPFDARTVRRRLEASLRRLGTDYVDVYQLHRVDPDGRFDDVLLALDAMVQEGKVLAIGASMCRADLVVEAQWRARELGVTRFTVEQAPYSIFVREVEAAVCDACRRHDVDLVAFAPINGGWLAGQYRVDQPVSPCSRAATFRTRPEKFQFDRDEVQRKLRLAEQLADIAASVGCTMSQLALAWVLARPAISATVVGPRTREQLDDLLVAEALPVTGDVLAAIDAIVPPGTTIDHADINGYASPTMRTTVDSPRDGSSASQA